MAGSLGAAVGVGALATEERKREAEYERLMKESARTLEEVKRQQTREAPAPAGSTPKMELPTRAPGRMPAPRVESEGRGPLSAPGGDKGQEIEEPDDESQSPLELSNPHGQHGKPDHQATVKRLVKQAEREFPDSNVKIETGTSIFRYTGVNRRPDVWVRDDKTKKVVKVYEAVRLNPDGALPKREQLKKAEYDRAGIPSHFEPVTP